MEVAPSQPICPGWDEIKKLAHANNDHVCLCTQSTCKELVMACNRVDNSVSLLSQCATSAAIAFYGYTEQLSAEFNMGETAARASGAVTKCTTVDQLNAALAPLPSAAISVYLISITLNRNTECSNFHALTLLRLPSLSGATSHTGGGGGDKSTPPSSNGGSNGGGGRACVVQSFGSPRAQISLRQFVEGVDAEPFPTKADPLQREAAAETISRYGKGTIVAADDLITSLAALLDPAHSLGFFQRLLTSEDAAQAQRQATFRQLFGCVYADKRTKVDFITVQRAPAKQDAKQGFPGFAALGGMAGKCSLHRPKEKGAVVAGGGGQPARVASARVEVVEPTAAKGGSKAKPERVVGATVEVIQPATKHH